VCEFCREPDINTDTNFAHVVGEDANGNKRSFIKSDSRIFNKMLYVSISIETVMDVSARYKIKYCPWCGRKL